MLTTTAPRPLRAALLCSVRAPGLGELLGAQATAGGFAIVAVVATSPGCAEIARASAAGVPAVVHDIAAFYAAAGARRGDLAVRRTFDRATVRLLAPFRPDLVLLDGYLHVITEPLLAAHLDRIVNVHDADLALRGAQGGPRYPGLHATRDAILAGERATRSSVHVVTDAVDAGPVLMRSRPFPVHQLAADARGWGVEGDRLLRAYAYAHREWMMRSCWGALLAETMRRYAGEEPETSAAPGLAATAPWE